MSANKSKRIYLMYFFTFFMGIYLMCYTLSIPYISRPVDHFCAPPFDFETEHWSPKNWRVWAIPYWDQVPESLRYRPVRPESLSQCLQFGIKQINSSDNWSEKFEIDYTIESITKCRNGWYFKDEKLSLISQV